MSAQLGATARRKGFGFSRLEGVGGMPCAMLALQRRTLIRDSSLKPRRTGGIMLVNSHYDIITRPIFENWLHYSTCILSPTKPEESASFARRGELKGGFWRLAFNLQTIFPPKFTWFSPILSTLLRYVKSYPIFDLYRSHSANSGLISPSTDFVG